MSLKKLKKAELFALAEEHGVDVESDANKAAIIEELTEAGITGEPEKQKPESKAERQARLRAREYD